jgi:hypothetical protein
VALAVTGLIASAATTAIFQVVSVNAGSVAHMTAVKQVENAVYHISRDAQMAQSVTTAGSSFPLNLAWVEWNNTTHQVSYSIQNGTLQRSENTTIVGQLPQTAVTPAAQYINTGSTSCTWDSVHRVLIVNITVSVGGFRPATETRTFQIIPRPG